MPPPEMESDDVIRSPLSALFIFLGGALSAGRQQEGEREPLPQATPRNAASALSPPRRGHPQRAAAAKHQLLRDGHAHLPHALPRARGSA